MGQRKEDPEARTGHLSVTVQQDGEGNKEPTKTSEMLFPSSSVKSPNPLKQQSKLFEAGPSFMEDNFSHGSGRRGWSRDVSSALPLSCTLFLI